MDSENLILQNDQRHNTLKELAGTAESQLLIQDEMSQGIKDINKNLEHQLIQGDKPEVQRISLEPSESTDDEDALATTFYKMLRGKQGPKGDKPIRGTDYFTSEEVTQFKEEITPTLGKDYYTPAEIADVIKEIADSIRVPDDGVTPVKGEDYFTNKEVASIVNEVLSKIKLPEDGKEAVIDYAKIIKDVLAKLPKQKDVKQLTLKDIKGNLSISDIADLEYNLSFLKNSSSKTVSLIELDDVNLTGLTQTNGKYNLGSGGSAIIVQDEGVTLTSALALLNFVGAGVTATTVGNDVTVTIPGGSSGSGDVVGPASAVNNNFAAFDTTTGKLIKDSGSKTSDFATAAQGAKVDFITVTQAVNLDTMESDITTNNAKVGITAGQASDITTNNAKVGITAGQASDITTNNAKVTNATHTGEVTGTTVLTIANSVVGIAKLSATGTPSASNFLRGDNTWDIPAGGGDMVLANAQTNTGIKTFATGTLISPDTTGGTAVGSNIIYKSTTGAGTAAGIAHQFVGGTNGATVAMTVLNNGNVGIGTITPSQTLDIGAGSMALITTNSSTSGIIFKGANRFIHNFAVPNTSGQNTYVGINAGTVTTANIAGSQGSNNTGIGFNALQSNAAGFQNTAIGADALRENNTGLQNTGIGVTALQENTGGSSNTGVGFNALFSNTNGENNTGIGLSAIRANTTGSNNTALGDNAGSDITTANNNTLIGRNTGRGITTGSNNTILGSSVTGLAAGLSNNIILADGAGNRRLNIDASGNVGIGTTTPTAVLHLKAGTATASTAPLKFTSGTLLTAAEAGAVEFLTDAYYGTITTGAVRKQFAFNPMTTGGDLVYGGASGVEIRLANGTAGQVLQSNGTTLAPSWGTSAGGGDMVLANAQTNTGAKTFNDTTLFLRNVANTFNGSFVNTNTADRIYTLQDRAGTLADNTDLALKANLASPTFTGTVVLPSNQALITPVLGVATATSIVASGDIRSARIGIGIDPVSLLTVSNQATIQTAVSGSTAHLVGVNASPLILTFDTHQGATTSGSEIIGRRSRGTSTTPTAVTANDTLASLSGAGYGATAYGSTTGFVAVRANQNFTDAAQGTFVGIHTTPDGSVTAGEVARFNATNLTLGVTGTMLGNLTLSGSTSGTVSLRPNAVAGAGVVHTLPATTGTVASISFAQEFTGVQTMTSPSFTTSVVTASTTMSVFNTLATTVNIAGAATTLTVGGTPTTAITHNYSTNATAAATTKTVNIATGAAASSTTNVNIGSALGGTTNIASSTLLSNGVGVPTVSSTSTLTNKTLNDAKIIGAFNSQTGTTYTLVLTDASRTVTMANAAANTMTIPPNSAVAFPIGTRILISQSGTGSTTIAAGAGVTINVPASVSLAIAEQFGNRGCQKSDTNTWLII